MTDLDLADILPVTNPIGIAAAPGAAWADLRVGELKALLSLAIGDIDTILHGCAWIGPFDQLSENRQRLYRCNEAMVQLEDSDMHTRLLAAYRKVWK